jgi:hypothetical protein
MDTGMLLLCGTFSSAVHIFAVYLMMPSVAHAIQHHMAELNKQRIRMSMEGKRHGLL